MQISFRLNGEDVTLNGVAPGDTTLDWLRERRGLTGTKEGCNEGDCGACTVLVSDGDGTQALNACILLLAQLHGKSLRTVEGIAGPEGRLHPVQQAMIDHHGSQCGFCTPGFVVAMAAAHMHGTTDHATALAGNLCRCTGYAPILRAARAAAAEPVPEWIADTAPGDVPPDAALPESAGDLATLLLKAPETTLVAGATDVGLWVTKALKDIAPAAFLHRCADMARVEWDDDTIRIGAMVSIEALGAALAEHHPSLTEMIRRFGSVQVRNAATIGGNIANGSPIGDGPPALIALGARLYLRRGDARRDIALEDFFIEYGRQDLRPGEFVEAVSIPRQPDRLRCYKLSKRSDQDISAVCGCFSITVEAGRVTAARIAFGGMAGVPKRADQVEATLLDREWSAQTVAEARDAFADDFAPMSDMRASAAYRLEAARNMLTRYFHEDAGAPVSVREVRP